MKGQKKENAPAASDNPLLKIDNRDDFMIDSSNLLQNPGILLTKGYERLDLGKENSKKFDLDKISKSTSIIIILRYYEYVTMATFKFEFVLPMLESGLNMDEVIDLIKHSLRNRLLVNAPAFDTIFEPEIQYTGRIRY